MHGHSKSMARSIVHLSFTLPFILYMAVVFASFKLSQLSCPGGLVGRSTRLERGVSWVRIPPRAVFTLKNEKAVLGVYICLTLYTPTCRWFQIEAGAKTTLVCLS